MVTLKAGNWSSSSLERSGVSLTEISVSGSVKVDILTMFGMYDGETSRVTMN